MTPTKFCERLVDGLYAAATNPPEETVRFLQNYLGTTKKVLGLKTSVRRGIVRGALAEFRALETCDQIEVMNELTSSSTADVLFASGDILSRSTSLRAGIDFEDLRRWGSQTSGWAECDSLFQSAFSGEEVLDRIHDWSQGIRSFARDQHIQVRRASLVLNVRPVREVRDARLDDLAFDTIDHLKHERAILITKAVSWLLRSLAVTRRDRTRNYLEENRSSLPAIAYRETLKKIETGKK